MRLLALHKLHELLLVQAMLRMMKRQQCHSWFLQVS
jgi:hypothetical protein